MVNPTIYQHFRAEERPLVDEFMALIAQAQTEYRPILTHFLNPRERYIIQTLLGNSDELKLEARGGYLAAERKRNSRGRSGKQANSTGCPAAVMASCSICPPGVGGAKPWRSTARNACSKGGSHSSRNRASPW